MSDAIPTGRFIWYELLTSDVAAAVPFYQRVAGWGTETWDEGEKPYQMWTAHDRPVAGVLHHVMAVPQVGKFAIVGDPLGAVFAVFAPENPMPAGSFEPKVGQFSWHELVTADHEAAFPFYSELLGWEGPIRSTWVSLAST